MIYFGFECDADGCLKAQRFTLRELSAERLDTARPNFDATFFDIAVARNRERGWRVEGSGETLNPEWDCKVFCPDHTYLHRDYKG